MMLRDFAKARLWGLTLATLIGVAILLTLGTWQMQRLQWKEALLAERAGAAAEVPVALPEALGDLAFRPTRATGTYLHDREMRLTGQYLPSAGRGPDRLGVHIATPLRLEDGSLLLVNRGWAPLEGAVERPAGLVTVTGLLRPFPEDGWFQPPNDPAKGAWFRMDPASMTAGLTGPVRPYYIDALAGQGGENPAVSQYPQGGQTRIHIANNHLQYALTWYSLAIVLLAVYAAFVRSRLRILSHGSEV